MTRFLLSTVSIFVLLITTFLLPQSVSARRCTVIMPNTLLSLYRTSDAIYIGKYEKSVDGEATEDTPEYTVVPITKHYTVSSALKGETRKMLTLDDTEYRYKNQETVEEESEEEGTLEESNEIQPGDQVLIFVSRDEESDAVELTDFDAIKKMTADELSSYETRIRELNGIFSGEKPSHSEVVDWLIRCAEDPHTRWEGTYELLRSFQNMEWQAEREAAAADKAADGSGEVIEQLPIEVTKDFNTGDPKFARSVTDTHKDLLTGVLLKRELPKKAEDGEGTDAMLRGDRELIELVARWGGLDVATNLLEQLRNGSGDANLNSELMASISSIFKDDELNGTSSEYSDIQWESDEDVIEPDEADTEATDGSDEDPAQQAAETTEVEAGAQTADNEPAERDEETSADIKGTDVPQSEAVSNKKTFGELRSELLAKFLARADTVIAIERNKSSAKLDN